jgi:hypothetical protein
MLLRGSKRRGNDGRGVNQVRSKMSVDRRVAGTNAAFAATIGFADSDAVDLGGPAAGQCSPSISIG